MISQSVTSPSLHAQSLNSAGAPSPSPAEGQAALKGDSVALSGNVREAETGLIKYAKPAAGIASLAAMGTIMSQQAVMLPGTPASVVAGTVAGAVGGLAGGSSSKAVRMLTLAVEGAITGAAAGIRIGGSLVSGMEALVTASIGGAVGLVAGGISGALIGRKAGKKAAQAIATAGGAVAGGIAAYSGMTDLTFAKFGFEVMGRMITGH
ncbi:MAG: hypothetical protein RDV48_16045 [Candidatus Eremiobacteraeota bacterium]|nr:hypothetical protein [Candidatus Eremiobacteraeota bacterium]